MKLSELKSLLKDVSNLSFYLRDKSQIPAHFHITEVGVITKNFIDCGGTTRAEKTLSFQIWVANDTEHRLTPAKLFKIIAASEKFMGQEDLEIEIEYQTDTIGKYGLDFNGEYFELTSKFTTCLAMEHCGMPMKKLQVLKSKISAQSAACCTPGSGCC